MADVHFLLHFRPRPRPLGLDWPRQRPVASRCGTVGATPLSVGGRRGKMDAATLTYDTLRFAEFEDFPETSEPVWILGRKYSIFTEKDEILSDVASRLWFTYRKNFPPIGGTGPTSDTGWGCMLRCGQMIFAQALVCRHLGRDWRWTQRKRQPDSYFNVLNAFIDRKDSYYSIHQIAQMGVGEGKSIGQWYGPNTVAQVLKKLAVFDTWSALAVHIAMDNTVVMEDIRRLCSGSLPCAGAASLSADSSRHCNGFPAGAEVTDRPAPWRPLVLLIPLRLGLTDINEAYVETLKRCFMMPQSLGVIGGKPNSAHYFIGYAGEELIYLDPHTTQPAVELTDSCFIADESFHCRHPPSRMSIGELDPSIAVVRPRPSCLLGPWGRRSEPVRAQSCSSRMEGQGFFCKTEDDFDDWCQQVRQLSLLGGALPMFELVEQQPSHLACPDVLNVSLDSSDVERLERFFDSEDEDFEILSL
ncbi:cysteine protease ATG4B isoform X2 [Ailuropoda melanoleuca]|uniref:cysteine protease ATG4B isoform X2 n=1 Tax=Ailuropoda melanoleuca TaxID=9646 RepID=UPI0014949F99|nr:cysteine protease ATG4B isoform X2 [Ailuropoda melanoleuca]